MTNDPFDALERRLRERVRAHGAAAPAGSRGRWWRRTPLLAIGAVGLTLTGGAFAATSLTRPGDEERGVKIAHRAERELRTVEACRAADAPEGQTISYTDAPILPAVKRALPWIASQPTDREAKVAAFLMRTWPTDGPVVRGTARGIDMGDGRYVLVALMDGQGPFGALRDPTACGALRRHRAAELADGRPVVLREALRVLAARVDVAPRVQRLSVTTTDGDCRIGGSPCGGGGGSMAFWPAAERSWNREVPVGLLGSMGKRYTGLGSPRAARVTISAKYPERLAGVPRSITLRRGFWILDLPRKSGPVRVTERAADGTVLRVVPIRGQYRST
jgi:hypothetical protein